MRSIATCYSEHAIKVSDSYCSGPSNHVRLSQTLLPSIINSVSCIYRAKLSNQKQILITLTWSNTQLGQGFNLNFSVFSKSSSHQIRGRKGSKKFESFNIKFEAFWDFSSAQFDSGPDPIDGYYLIILANSEIIVILGDMDEEHEVQKVKDAAKMAAFSLISRTEHFSGKALYSTKAQFSERGISHDILIQCNREDPNSKNLVLSVLIDERKVIQVKRLKWNFRGNQSIFVDGLLVDMLWDVHDWFFNPDSGFAVFMFRTRSGLGSRLWLEEKSLVHEDHHHDKVEFSFLICACKKLD